MKRRGYASLLKWKAKRDRKPLQLHGARQVGKSHLLAEFGKNEFNNYHIFNFEKDPSLKLVFEKDLNPVRIIADLSIIINKKIDLENDLIIFDEIQECPKAMTSLKYFCEEMPQVFLCSASSLLGVKLSSESFPVGKVEFMNLHPMSFEEFLMALNDKVGLQIYRSIVHPTRISEVAHLKLWNILKEYYVTGGMPKVVAQYVVHRENKFEAMTVARETQKNLVQSYSQDFAKHSGKTNSMHIVSVFENVPMQLAKNLDGSVKRYRFKEVISGKKSYADLQGPINWLEKAGLVIKVNVCNKAELPFEAFCSANTFKLYMFDIGLLGAMLDLPFEALLAQDYGITKGYFAENFVVQEFKAGGLNKFYSWSERTSEIEFIRSIAGEIIPVEVKAGHRTQAKSLTQYIKKYKPKQAIKISGNNFSKSEDNVIVNYPLYGVALI